MRLTAVLIGATALALAAAPTRTNAQQYDRDAALRASQAAIGHTIGEYTFRDTQGQSFSLQTLRGKPMVISMIYTSCHHICPLITQNLEKTVGIAREALGDDSFTVVSIGFDWPVDTAEQMRVYASSRGIDQSYWHFLSGDEWTTESISSDVGFQFFPSPKGYDHLSQTTIVDGNGTVYRQVYGQDFDAPALVEPLKELVFNTPVDASIIDHWVDSFRFFCTVYDPNSGRYKFDYSVFMTILVGALCLGAILVFLVSEWRQSY